MPPAGDRPQTGSNIALDHLRIQLKYPISVEQWRWFASQGWRKIDLRTDRRQYHKVDEQLAQRLLLTDDEEERDRLYQLITQPLRKQNSNRFAA